MSFFRLPRFRRSLLIRRLNEAYSSKWKNSFLGFGMMVVGSIFAVSGIGFVLAQQAPQVQQAQQVEGSQPPSGDQGGQGGDIPPGDQRQPGGQQQQPPQQGGSQNCQQGGSGQQGGMSEEEQQAQQEKMDKQNLANMQKNMKQASKQFATMKTYLAKQAKKGIVIPSECTQALADGQNVIDTVKNATTMDALGDIQPSDLNDSFNTLNDCRQTVDRLSRIPSEFKQIDRQTKSMEAQWNLSKKNAPAEASSAIADGDTILQGIKDARAKAGEEFKAGNPDDAEAALQDGVYGAMQDLGSTMQRVMAVKNSKRFFTDFAARLKTADKKIASLTKAKQDTSEATRLLGDMKDQFVAIKTMDVGSDEFMSAVEAVMQVSQAFDEATGGDSSGQSQQQCQPLGGPTLQMQKF